MRRFLRALFSKTPAIIALAGLLAGGATGQGWLVAAGVFGAAAIALRRTLSREERALEEASRLSGVLNEIHLDDLKRLKRALRRASRIPGAEHAGLQASEQFNGIQQRFINFRDVLLQRFSEGELTHGRYLASGQQVYRSVLDALRRIESLLKGIEGVDVDYTRARLRELGKKEGPSEAERREIESLTNRLTLRDVELGSVRELLASNERAITQLVSATTSLANVQTVEGLASVKAETAIAELENLAGRAGLYSLEDRR